MASKASPSTRTAIFRMLGALRDALAKNTLGECDQKEDEHQKRDCIFVNRGNEHRHDDFQKAYNNSAHYRSWDATKSADNYRDERLKYKIEAHLRVHKEDRGEEHASYPGEES